MDTRIFSDAEWLMVQQNRGYGLAQIPHARDQQIEDLLERWLILEPSARWDASQGIHEEQLFTLLAYSERMASAAVRTGEARKILLGLIALGIDGWQWDWRENAALLVLHYDAAKRIHADAGEIFGQAGRLLSIRPRTEFSAFLRRSPEDQSLESMGYEVTEEPGGFLYRRTW